MITRKRKIVVFMMSLVSSYLLVGLFIHTMLMSIDWVETATLWHKINAYYIVSFYYNIIPSVTLAGIITISYILINKARKKQ